jgi:uncharacterized protein
VRWEPILEHDSSGTSSPALPTCGQIPVCSAHHPLHCGIVELDELLSTLVNDVDGALGAAIGGMDGLLIEQYAADSSLNLDTIIAEHANILKSVKAAYSASLTAGNVTEILITAEQIMGFTKEVTSEFFLTIILEPKGNVGKARLLGQQAAGRIREVVS